MDPVVAFSSGVALAIVVHFFTVRRKKLELWDQEYALFEAAKEELRYALRELEFLKRGLVVDGERLEFRGYAHQPPFRATLVKKMGPDSPISPRVIVVLNSLFDEIEAVALRIRTGPVTREDKVFLERTTNYALSIFAAYSKVTSSLRVPASSSITAEDIEEAKKLVGFLSAPNAL